MGEDDFGPVAGVSKEPRERLDVEDPQALIAMVQPLRARITRRLIDVPRTAAELAAEFGVPPTRLYYHLDLLVEHGIIQVVATRQRRGVEERRYRAVAHDYSLHERVLREARERPELLDDVVRAMFEGARAELRGVAGRLGEQDRNAIILARSALHLDTDRRQEFVQRVKGLIDEFDGDEGAHRLGLLIAAYPLGD